MEGMEKESASFVMLDSWKPASLSVKEDSSSIGSTSITLPSVPLGSAYSASLRPVAPMFPDHATKEEQRTQSDVPSRATLPWQYPSEETYMRWASSDVSPKEAWAYQEPSSMKYHSSSSTERFRTSSTHPGAFYQPLVHQRMMMHQPHALPPERIQTSPLVDFPTHHYRFPASAPTTGFPHSVQKTTTPFEDVHDQHIKTHMLTDYFSAMNVADEELQHSVSGPAPVGHKRVKSHEERVFVPEEIQGNVFRLAKDQNGCRFLQRKIEEGDTTCFSIVYEESLSHFTELMVDPFGNYLCQKLVEFSDDEKRTVIINIIAPNIVKISLNMHGTRAVQKVIEHLRSEEQIRIVTEALKSHVVSLIKDLNGNHVIQRCLHVLTSEAKQFIYDAVAGRCVEVATHRHGCCVLQRCIDYASDSQRRQLTAEIAVHALQLVQDPFGNYVVQYVLDMGDVSTNHRIMLEFRGHICDLSMNKFSSNVIEKCLRLAEPHILNDFLTEMADSVKMSQLLQDSFANYVIQTALSVSDATQFSLLAGFIRPYLPLIRNTPYGKKVENKLNRRHRGMAAHRHHHHHRRSGSSGGDKRVHHSHRHQMAHMQQQRRGGPRGGFEESSSIPPACPTGGAGSFQSEYAEMEKRFSEMPRPVRPRRGYSDDSLM
eukprot:TRINITY_DN952_c0_g1_i2.p1 TRINITY_DN952_c0_g1~~TRINITY_DN952_c0_g1_i2.p1  ORF type:complete len:655 (+),score=147.47 TRINITY_DN952_c0_g1_i2:169-2133(+)